MPSQITPQVNDVLNTVSTTDAGLLREVDNLLEIHNRMLKQLEQITGFELKEGEI